jgi:NTE family protein
VVLSHGDLGTAVLASASIPAVLPPVTIDGRLLFDGGIANNTPISHAVALGAERVVVLPAVSRARSLSPPRAALAVAVHAISLLVAQRLVHDAETYQDSGRAHRRAATVPALGVSRRTSVRRPCSSNGRATTTTSWLEAGSHRLPHPERFLGLHRHDGLVPVGR